jgi:hypothetical protein
MGTATEFLCRLDEEGRLRDREGSLDVVFATRGGGRFPGTLHFQDGLCVRAGMNVGGDWENADGTPLDGLKFLLHFDDGSVQGIAIDQGHIIFLGPLGDGLTKKEFLRNFKLARNLFAHQRVTANVPGVDPRETEKLVARAALWLVPGAVAGFSAADFPELAPARREDLQAAVADFLAMANRVRPDRPATDEEYCAARAAIERLQDILDPYVPRLDESEVVEKALGAMSFPRWVLGWDFELGRDSDDNKALWLDVFTDEESLPSSQLGRASMELADKVREALSDTNIDRWPYIRMRSARERMVGAR